MKRLLACVLLLGCAPRAPTPPLGSHKYDAPAIVPHPPPAPRAQVLPPPPSEDALWVDGTWEWNGQSYVWNDGRWHAPIEGATHAPMTTVRQRTGQLMFYPGGYRVERSDERE